VSASDETIDAFISYQSEEEVFAKKLASSIEAYSTDGRRLKTFLAPWDIKPGDNFIEKLNEGLEKARFFLIVLSPKALEAEWPTSERDAAIYSDPSGRLGRIIPIMRRPCRIPPLLKFRNYLDFRSDSKYEVELTRLLCVLTGASLPRECTPLGLYKAVHQKKPGEVSPAQLCQGESWKPDPVVEDICSNLFPAKFVPPKIWSAPCFIQGGLRRYFEPEVIIPPYFLRESRLFTFVDLSQPNNIFHGVVEDYDVKSIDTKEWLKDEVHSRWLVELLNFGINNHCAKLNFSFDDNGKKHYYKKNAVIRKVKWMPSTKKVTKELIIEYLDAKPPFVAHRAVRSRFQVCGSLIFLQLNSGWTFTSDGFRLIEGQLLSNLSTKFMARQKNKANFNEIRFWAWWLSEDGKTIKMDFGKSSVEIDVKPLSTSVIGGVFGDYSELSKMTSGPPKIFEEEEEEEELES
jgi:hypothetical protein